VIGFATAFGVVFVAELGDKSQLLVVSLATRYRPGVVFAGLVIAEAVASGLSVTVGAAAATAVPERALEVVAGVAFFGFGLWTLLTAERAEPDEASAERFRGSHVLTTALALGAAELGDKTMLAAIALAARFHPVAVWAGVTAGSVSASGLALVAARLLGMRVPRRTLRLVSAGLFAVFGGLLLAGFGG
jgi:putative Ca2+/H+ antiporter (TMEM165/GDT1 family)